MIDRGLATESKNLLKFLSIYRFAHKHLTANHVAKQFLRPGLNKQSRSDILLQLQKFCFAPAATAADIASPRSFLSVGIILSSQISDLKSADLQAIAHLLESFVKGF